METAAVKLSETQTGLVEKLGTFYERSGLNPVAARILALLLVADEHDLTFEQIQVTLGVSKSATSTSINLLLNTEKIEQISKLGQRKRYFRNRIAHWKDDIQRSYEHLGFFSELLKTNLRQRPGDTIEFNQSMKELIDFLDFLQRELPALYRKWESERN